MTSFRVIAVSAMALGSVGWLWADTLPVDPLIKFTTGGDATSITCTSSGCSTTLAPPIDASGFVDLGVTNGTTKTITALEFFIPTTNFNQTFSASTNTFTQASIFADEAHNLLRVEFFGTGNAAPGFPAGGSFTFPPDPTDPGTGAPGFEPGGVVTVDAFFVPPAVSGPFTGLLPGETGTLSLSAPEPSMVWLSLVGGLGLLLARRKLRKA
jgi:hypothetical protein